MRRSDVNTYRFTERAVEQVKLGAVPLTTPASTWVLLAPGLSTRDAVALGDAVIRRHRFPGTSELVRQPLANVEELNELIARPYRRHRARLDALLPQLSTASASPPESHLRLLLRQWDLPQPELDFDVRSSDGEFLGCSEFAYPAFRLALEYEGDHHRTERSQWERDIAKYRAYAEHGWEVFRVTAGLLYREPSELRRQIVAALSRRG